MRPKLSTILTTLAAMLVIGYTDAKAEETAPPPAPVALPAWMSVEVVKAAVDIHMTDAQQHEFNEAVGDFVGKHFAMIPKEVKKEAPDLEQRVRSRDGALVRQLDARIQPILTAEQWPAYESYKKALRAQLSEMPLPQGSTGTRTPHGVGGGQG
jgi:hypothetical protein